MIEYRRMRLSEVDAVAELGVEALRTHAGEVPLHISPGKVRMVVNDFCIRPEHFHEVAFKDGQPIGAVAMRVVEAPFHERFDGHVMMAFCREPGPGLKLINDMVKWARSDMRIARVQWCMNECNAGRFAGLLTRRWGFEHRVDNLICYRGES